jgi:tripartite-type tricarboxylate transporter receptor subunit TctC
VKRLHDQFARAARDPDITRIVKPQATDVLITSPEDFSKMIASDTARLGKVIREAGIKLQ